MALFKDHNVTVAVVDCAANVKKGMIVLIYLFLTQASVLKLIVEQKASKKPFDAWITSLWSVLPPQGLQWVWTNYKRDEREWNIKFKCKSMQVNAITSEHKHKVWKLQ